MQNFFFLGSGFNRQFTYFSSVGGNRNETSRSFSDDGNTLSEKNNRINFSLGRVIPQQNQQDKYICPVCGKKLKNTSHYQYHLRIHSGEKPFSCYICQKSFRNKGNLRRHHLVHAQMIPITTDL